MPEFSKNTAEKGLGDEKHNRRKQRERETLPYRDLYHIVKRLTIVWYMYPT